MKAVIVYESMYGNTHAIADHIGEGLRSSMEVATVTPGPAVGALLADADLVVVGGPTHVHGMTSKKSREAAVDAVEKRDDVELDPTVPEEGLRDWFHDLPKASGTPSAAFDTRIDAAPALTGRASKGIARRLHKHGFEVVVDPESFLVDKHDQLLEGEVERARAWGATLAAQLAPAS